MWFRVTHVQSVEDFHKKETEVNLKHSYKMTSGDTLKPGKNEWKCVTSDGDCSEGDNI
jgi:hypothetical protein